MDRAGNHKHLTASFSGRPGHGLILVLNCGSSSIKFAVFDPSATPLPRQALWNGKVQGIGGADPDFGETGVAPFPIKLDTAHPYPAALLSSVFCIMIIWFDPMLDGPSIFRRME